jgi:hypothetical protein
MTTLLQGGCVCSLRGLWPVELYNEVTLYLSLKIELLRFGIPTAVTMKSSVIWAITTCSPVKVNLRFEGIYCLHLQGP